MHGKFKNEEKLRNYVKFFITQSRKVCGDEKQREENYSTTSCAREMLCWKEEVICLISEAFCVILNIRSRFRVMVTQKV